MNKVVLGILSTVFAVVSLIIFWWLSIVALVLGIIGLAIKTEVQSYKIAGIVLSVIGIVIAAIGLILVLVAFLAVL